MHRVCRSTIRADGPVDCNVTAVSVLRRVAAFGALVVVVVAGRARLLQVDEQRSGYGPPERTDRR